MKVLVSGSTGFVGAGLVNFLEADGYQVERLRRRSAKDNPLGWTWDCASADRKASDGVGVDAVVHLAGENIAGGRWTARRKALIRASRVEGTRLLVEGLLRAGRVPRVWVAASATGYYGDRAEEVLTEESTPGQGFLPEVCQAWEQAATSLQDAGVRVVWLRIGMVLGEDGGALARIQPLFRCGLGGVLGSGKQYWNWIHRGDLVRVIEQALSDDSMRGAFNAVAPDVVTNRQFTKTLARGLRRPAWVPAPGWGLRLVLGEMANAVLLSSARVLPQRLTQLGFSFQYGKLSQALAAVSR